MTATTISRTDRKLSVLLADFGYAVQGDLIIAKAIPGFTSERVVGRCRCMLDAAERLCPIVRQNEFTNRLIAITDHND